MSVKEIIIKTKSIDLQAQINFVIKILTNLFCSSEEEFILINTYIAREDLMKHHFPDKDALYICLNMEGIVSVYYRHTKIVYKEFKKNNLGDYHDLYAQSDASLLADVFENFRNKCFEIYELDSTHFWFNHSTHLTLISTDMKVKLELLTVIDMSLSVEKRTKGEICHSIHMHAKTNNSLW